MNILTEVDLFCQNYKSPIHIVEGLTFNQYETLRMIEFYTNSHYMNGDVDGLGRLKPFYNIVNFRVNIATKATDLDTKDIQVFTEDPKYYIRSMIFNKEVKNWMREAFFSKTLNEINETRARYGGVVVKKVIKNGKLTLEVPQWKNLRTDRIDIKNLVVEKHYLTMQEIQDKEGVWNKLNAETLEKVKKAMYAAGNNKGFDASTRVCVAEVQGSFPSKYVEGNGDDYRFQRHYILMNDAEKTICCLESSFKDSSDYKYCPWVRAAGRGLGIGVVEDGFHAQYSTNDVVLKERDIMEIAARTLFYTDSNILENNILSDLQTGDIINVEKDATINLINSMPSSVPELRNIAEAWDQQYSRVTGTFEAVTGETMPSGTPFRAIALQNQEGQSTFNYRREDYGIFLNEIFTDWVLPHITNKVNKEHVLAADFDEDELKQIDEDFAKNTAKRFTIDKLLEGQPTTQDQFDLMVKTQTEQLNSNFGSKRSIKMPKDYYKDVQFKLDILTTGEQINKSAVFETISNIITTVAGNPAVLQDPILRKLFAKIIELSGVGVSINMNNLGVPPQPTQGSQPTQPTEFTAPEQVGAEVPLPA